jgi:hypothetical protein
MKNHIQPPKVWPDVGMNFHTHGFPTHLNFQHFLTGGGNLQENVYFILYAHCLMKSRHTDADLRVTAVASYC